MAKPIQWTPLIVPNGGIDETSSPQKLPPEKWAAAENVEPMTDGVRSRQGSVASNAIPLQTAQQSYEDGTGSVNMADASAEYVAQSFQDASDMTVSRVAVRLKINSGNPSGDVKAAVYENNLAKPTTVVSGMDVTDFSSVSASSITSEYAWYFFTLATGVVLDGGTTYHLVIAHTSATGSDSLDVEADAAGTYASGELNYSTNASAWTTVSTSDLNFRVYSGGAPITAIADYQLSDRSDSRHLVYAGGELYKNVGGVMTAVSARERESMTPDDDELPSWCVGQDIFRITNNVEVSKTFYIKDGVEYYENEGIAAPTASISLGTGTGNALPDGTYYVDYYYWNDDLKQPSQRRYLGVADTNNDIATVSQHITISGLPATTVRENDRATHIRIELREVGSSIFRFKKEVTLGTTSTTITSADADTTVEAQYEHDVAPVHRCKCVAANRQFIADVEEDVEGTTVRRPYRLMFSSIVGTTPYYSSFDAFNYRDFGRGDGDYITGLWFLPPRTLIVGCKNSVWAIDARNPATSDRFIISRNQGVASTQAGVVVGSRFYFFSNAAQQIGHYMWQQGQPEPKLVLGIDNTVKGLSLSRNQYASCAAFAPGEDRFQWWTLVSSNGSSVHDKVLVYDWLLGAWTIYTKGSGTEGAVIGVVDTGSGVDKMFMGGTNGVEYEHDQGITDAGTEYSSSVTLGVMDFGYTQTRKRHRWVDMVAQQNTEGNIGISAVVDYGERAAISDSLDHTPLPGRSGADAMTWGTGTWGTDIWGTGESPDLKRRTAFRGLGDTFQHTLSSTAKFHLKGIAFGWQPTRRP